jgi:hypothetical protein
VPGFVYERGADDASQAGLGANDESSSQSGTFTVSGGTIASPDELELGGVLTSKASGGEKALPITGDLTVRDSLCVGFDCVDSEAFGADTILLKENNLRIHFDDTSTSGTFPLNDWRILINDTSNGGASYFALEDVTGGKVPFRIEAGARNNALFVDSQGEVGIGTSTPAADVHVQTGNTPTIRLEQDNTSGWNPQTWDVAGNETNFFIRDITNGSTLPFRIRPGAATSSIEIEADSDVRIGQGNLLINEGKFIGMGIDPPVRDMDIRTADRDAKISVIRSDAGGTTSMTLQAGGTFGKVGTTNNKRLQFVVNDQPVMTLREDNSIYSFTGAQLTAGGVWTNASSRELKENIEALTVDEAYDALFKMSPVKYNYKVDKEDKYVGFIAEDVPELVASKDHKGMSSMDVTAVLTKVVQDQQNTINALKARLDALEAKENKE